ncbi:MAG: glycosyl hydrolase family 65 protein [Dehalococcoidia bacterium]
MSDWSLEYQGFDPKQEPLREALCTLGNGYFATRGAAAESRAGDVHYPGTYIAGCYNRLKSKIPGHVVEKESLVNAPNWLPLEFRTADEPWFDPQAFELLEYRQELNLRQGVLTRLVRFRDARGRHTRVVQRRFVSMADPHIAALETTFVAENWSGRLIVRSALDGRVENTNVKRYLPLDNNHLAPVEEAAADDYSIYLQVETSHSHIRIAEAARTRLFINGEPRDVERRLIREPGYIAQEFSIDLAPDAPVTVEKVAAVFNSKDHAVSEPGLEACQRVERADAFDQLLEQHVLAWDHLWRRCRLDMQDNERSALVLNLHVFHLLQTTSENTVGLDVSVPARGLHGEGYRGHIFWDEIFICPFLNFRFPEITRSILLYRYRRLPEAQWAAKHAGYEGAMFPWQSGSNGREETDDLRINPLSGHWIRDHSYVQRHIGIALVFNVWHYYQVTGDIEFLSSYGAELILEIARFWSSIATYNRSLDRYEICGVMGPDEFHDAYPGKDEHGLDNNSYTNVMASWVLCRAMDILEIIPEWQSEALRDRLGLKRSELDRWDDVSRKLRVVINDDGIISQFEGYDQLEEFDWHAYRRKYGNIQRLDRILEAEGDTPNRYKASKQADVLMLFYLLSADELREVFARLNYPFEYETIPRNVEYYLARTSHGSTLSRVVHSWVLSRSQRGRSWELFKEALESDISDIQGGTTQEGIHLGAMAGTVDILQRCYTGIDARGDRLWINPCLPVDLKQLSFDIRYRGHWLTIQVDQESLKISSRPGTSSAINMGFRNEEFELAPGEGKDFKL